MTAVHGTRFRGTHTTTYAYSQAVFLTPHTIRLRPRTDPGQIVHGYEIEIDPVPDGMTSALDVWGNSAVWAWFSGTHERLEITTRFDVQRTRSNPYDFIVPSAEGATIPPAYADHERVALEPYLASYDPGDDVRKFADETAEAAGGNVLDFAGELARAIPGRCETIVRPTGEPHRGAELLVEGRGSCRDFAVLYIEACRHAGIASRFVSGYVAEGSEDEPRDLHAWVGVYVPGGGWRGFDPTQGVAVSTGHVTLAVADSPAGAAPVTGSFAKTGARSEMTSVIEFEVEEIPVAG